MVRKKMVIKMRDHHFELWPRTKYDEESANLNLLATLICSEVHFAVFYLVSEASFVSDKCVSG